MNRKHKIIKNNIFNYSLLMLLIIFLGCDNSEEQTVATFTNLVMGDDFDTDGMLDSSVWTYDIGTGTNGWGNNELQYYTNDAKNVTVQNGVLIISAEQEDFNGSSYTSARIKTQGLFDQTYGRFEARIKLPYGQGIWPAFWLLGSNIDTVGWPQCGELDVMEFRGQEPTVIHGSMHGPGYSGGESVTKSYTLENDRFDTGFHVFGIEWGPDYVNYYVDDVLYNQIKREDVTGEWVFDQPFFIIINLAVGGDFLGAPNASTVFPQRMLVDYVRVYKQ
ncbi:Glycosyl hydrolases family 16 [Tenacibaculum sp. MAR_2009_124]|uniref:glycoside hydrolase family 16 protein n=1 Tax=Tenacibaculum sp. MAR_2009_124 TaxID=1250059 RepID=UPI000895809A|nr:glycoside hydrolase family 16 protein [Tenacibaculum sp. MAR_2009_124]SEC77034.1 Glycosyl hydrolases family 16 [Tenacibaculum sp. MAR_2009_124]